MREPYPLALVPLIPQFLNRRRAKADFPLRAMERFGLDRPSYLFALDLGTQDPHGARPEDIGSSAYRTSDAPLRSTAAAAESAGLVTWAEGRWSLTEKGRAALEEYRRAIDAHFASLTPIAAAELEELATLLDQAFQAASASAEPATREHTARAKRYRWQEPSSPMARLDAAVYGLWMVRDDCHMQAWRDAGLAGPALDVLTKVWRKEATSVAELSSPARPEADTQAAVQELRDAGLVAAGLPLAATSKGTGTRERIEAETDRYFFAPWPDSVGRKADQLIERLGAVNEALA